MDPSRHKPVSAFPVTWFLVFALLFVIQVLPRLESDSLTHDETMEITNGYVYLTEGDVMAFGRHPPLATAWHALPLLFMGLQGPGSGDSVSRAQEFFFAANFGRLEAMTYWPRFMTMLLGLATGFLLLRIVRARPFPEIFAVLALWVFSPVLLAFSGYAMADVPLTFLVLAAVTTFRWSQERSGWVPGMLAGAVMALAACTKFSGLILVPVFAAIDFLAPPGRSRGGAHHAGIRWGAGIAGFLLTLGLVYLPGTWSIQGHPDPFRLFIAGLRDLMAYGSFDHPVFFMGELSDRNHPLYFPVAFLLKNPLPFILLLVLVAGRAVGSREGWPPWLWVPPLGILLAILLVQNLGVRYLLPAFPFLFIVAGREAARLWDRGSGHGRWFRSLVIGLFVWLAGTVALSFPYHVAYFHDGVPADRRGWWLGDSNLDIGQDLKRLAATARARGWTQVRLAYYGARDPAIYGIPWRRWSSEDVERPRTGRVYAAHIGFFQIAPAFYPVTRPIAEGWMRRIPPTGRSGATWYYWEMPGDLEPDRTPWVPSAPGLSFIQKPVVPSQGGGS